MITVRNAQNLWTSVTNSYFYTTTSSLFVSCMWLFTLISKIMRKTWSYLISSLTRRRLSSLSISVSNHSIDFEWPLWAFGAWGCTQQGQAVYVPGSVVELSGQMRAESDIVWHHCSLLSVWTVWKFCRAFWGMAIHESAAFLHMPVGSSQRPQRILNQTSCSTALPFTNICIPGFTTSVLSRRITAASQCESFQNSCQTLNSETPLHWKWMNMVCKCLPMFAWFAWCKCSGFNVQRYPPQLESSWLHRSMLTPEFNFFHCRWSVEISVSSSIDQAKSRKQHETNKNRRWMERRDWRSPLLVRSHWKETSRGMRTMKNPAGKLPR